MVKLDRRFIANTKALINTNTRSRRLIIAFGLLALWCAIVLPVILTQYFGTTSKSIEYLPEKTSATGIYIDLSIQKIDTVTRKVDVKVNLRALNEYSLDLGISNQNITCNFMYKQITVLESKVSQPSVIELPITGGNPRAYPFEVLNVGLNTHCEDKDGTSVLPLINFDRTLETYYLFVKFGSFADLSEDVKLLLGQFPDPSFISMDLSLTQPTKNILFVIFVFLIMWGLTFAVLFFTIDVIFHNREIIPPLISVGTSLLFALPGIRNIQPGVPLLGCLSDFASFFWCLGLVSLCTVCNMFAFTLRYKKTT